MRTFRQPSHAEEHFKIGRELILAGDNVSAVQYLAKAIELQPDYFAAYYQLGLLQQTLGDLDAAKAWYLLAIRCPKVASAVYADLGDVCAELEHGEEAAGYFLRALGGEPLDRTRYLKVGVGLARLGQLTEAMDALSRSIELTPSAEAWSELGVCHFQLRDPVSAEAAYRKALQCDPEYAPAHANLGLTLLLQGNYGEGFQEFDWRLKAKVKNFYHIEGFQAPMWKGEPLEGKTILIHAEQGFGDTLQFLRFVPMVAARGARVLLVVQPALHRLVTACPGVAECLSIAEKLPDIDFQCPLMSLPHVVGTTLANIPDVVPLRLQQPNDRVGAGPLRVGLVWAGNPGHLTDRKRSIHLKNFLELGTLGDAVSFISLQHGAAAKQLTEEHLPFEIQDACSTVKDFADTADIVAGLDLVIAVDTAIAHLAGCLGKPVWVLLGSVPEWRWALKGETTPWYPTMRLFRMDEHGGLMELMKRVGEELKLSVTARDACSRLVLRRQSSPGSDMLSIARECAPSPAIAP
jgi:tetratricopeptide (TPR) repeat protein